ncbi:dimethylarginine dimethylaminohydrolase family protein [Aquibacillus salsiterrae]|uniref:Arginine deiminase family protein n=1 Tax=Aquibacillus salsiterrae TaxID=2950439 RepID=A0A9X4AHC7_9BACI|nr:arginine deiminase family protein [Aquibacillus salsiterrae]MDC3418180.1 arginine deiminase family protein [Aquibacillus salsiterrae]
MQAELESEYAEISCRNEYDPLQRVVVCSPKYMEIKKIINETQKLYKEENIDVDIAMDQHREFVQVLKDHQIDVIELTPEPKFHEQVFTRDIGYVIGPELIVSQMGQAVRIHEVDVLKRALDDRSISYLQFEQKSMEGGDVIIDGDKVWVGISDRTTYQAVEALQELLPSHQVTAVPIEKRILHLDCAFNIVGRETALIYPEAFEQKEYQLLASHYHLIEIPKEEELTLGTNVLAIGNNKIISMPQNKQVNQQLREKGYTVIEVDFSEIIKSGGSFRCCSLPLLRR